MGKTGQQSEKTEFRSLGKLESILQEPIFPGRLAGRQENTPYFFSSRHPRESAPISARAPGESLKTRKSEILARAQLWQSEKNEKLGFFHMLVFQMNEAYLFGTTGSDLETWTFGTLFLYGIP